MEVDEQKRKVLKTSDRRKMGQQMKAKKAPVRTLRALQAYVRREGRIVGEDNCYWADEFAHATIADALGICLLFIDMERSSGTNPFRILAAPAPIARTSNENDKEGVARQHTPRAVIVLKRSKSAGGHFVFLEHQYSLQKLLQGNEEKSFAPSAKETQGEEERAEHQEEHAPRACFLAGELPDVIKTLWESCLSDFPLLVEHQQDQTDAFQKAHGKK